MDNRNTQFNGKLKFKVEVHVRDEYCQEANGSELSNHYQVFDVLCDLWSTSRQNECSNFPILLLCQDQTIGKEERVYIILRALARKCGGHEARLCDCSSAIRYTCAYNCVKSRA